MFLTLFFVLFVVFLSVSLLTLLIIYKCKLYSMRKKQETVNLNTFQCLNVLNFGSNKKIFFNDYATHNKPANTKQFIAINNKTKQLCLTDYEQGKALIINFNEVLDYEIHQNGDISTSRDYVDGVCKNLKLIIKLKRKETPEIVYKLISKTLFNLGINKSTETYKECVLSLQEATSFLDAIKKENSSQPTKILVKSNFIICNYCLKKNTYDTDTCKHCGAPIG